MSNELLLSASWVNLPRVQILVRSGLSVTDRNPRGRTALLCAALSPDSFPMSPLSLLNMIATCKWLLESGGSSILETDDSGNSIWDYLLIMWSPSPRQKFDWVLASGPGNPK
jgi:hypothetical protein